MRTVKNQITVIICVLFTMHIGTLTAQTEYKISGHLLDESEQPVMFANVALWQPADSSIIAGTVSGEDGTFELQYNTAGAYLISASFIGYQSFQKTIELAENRMVDLGKIVLQPGQTALNEVVIKKARLKAKQQVDKTTYYANVAMKTTSNTGIDMIQQIPGVQVDLLQNISLNGSQKIIILVNGIERDAAFLGQLNPDKIDRIEIQNAPGVEYNADVSGVINVILKENENTGISGHFYANIPTALDEVFSFPTAALNYSCNKLTLFASYNGGFSYFDIKTEDKRVFSDESKVSELIKNENLYQQNWSHKLHFGADYFFNEKNQLNVYGFISRFSNEQSGSYSLSEIYNTEANRVMHYNKDDYDINNSAYTAVFYKHIFAENTEFTVDVNYYALESENRLRLSDLNSSTEQISRSRPQNNLLKTRLSFRFPLNQFVGVKTGFEQTLNHTQDDLMPEFTYTESASAAYISTNYTKDNIQANAGIRAEYLRYGNAESHKNQFIAMPALHIKYGFSSVAHLRFSYKQGIVRPHVFQLNPNVQTLDFYTRQKGNPELRPESNHNINLDYSLTFGDNFLNVGLFYTYKQDVIETLTLLNNKVFLEKEIQNLGNVHQLGISTSGSFKLHQRISINPQIKFYNVRTQGNELARKHQIENKQTLNYESALSAVLLMKHDLAFSVSAQYKSPLTRIQHHYHEDALYFVSVEKTFFDQLKLGITSAIPFKKTFTYRGNNIVGTNFDQSINENIQMSLFPVWFKLSYSFASGKGANRIERDNSFEENRPKKGF